MTKLYSEVEIQMKSSLNPPDQWIQQRQETYEIKQSKSVERGDREK
jgi:hypothetical protein